MRAPQMIRREVQLINGELVLECKIPTILYSFLPRRDEIEFTHMRYTAVTCALASACIRSLKKRSCNTAAQSSAGVTSSMVCS